METLNNTELRKLKSKVDEARRKKYNDDCGKRLDKIASTKIMTAVIGALDTFEKTFGWLWGHDSDESLTQTQKDMLELWQKARTDILDNGHTQLRGLQAEIANHVVHWNKYTMTLPVRPMEKKTDE